MNEIPWREVTVYSPSGIRHSQGKVVLVQQPNTYKYHAFNPHVAHIPRKGDQVRQDQSWIKYIADDPKRDHSSHRSTQDQNSDWVFKLQDRAPTDFPDNPPKISYSQLIQLFEENDPSLLPATRHGVSMLKMRNRHWPEVVSMQHLAGTRSSMQSSLQSEIIAQFCHLIVLLQTQFDSMCNPKLYRASPWVRENRHQILCTLAFFDRLDYDDEAQAWVRLRRKRGRSHFAWSL